MYNISGVENMKIEKMIFQNQQWILKTSKETFFLSEYVYKCILPYEGKILNQEQIKIVTAFHRGQQILKSLSKKVFLQQISRQQCQEKLLSELNEEDTSIILNTFQEDGYLNDEKFAKTLIEKNKNCKGKKEIRKILLQQKIDENLIIKLLEDFNENDEYIEQYVTQKYKTFSSSKVMFIQKMKEQLYAKGFELDRIQNVLSHFDFHDDLASLQQEYKKYSKLYDNQQKIISKLRNKGYNVEDIKDIIRKSDKNE